MVHKVPDQVHDPKLVVRIELCDRLIGDQQRCFGGKRPGAVHPSQFTAGQCRGGAAGQRLEIARGQRALHGLSVAAPQPPQRSTVGKAAQCDHVPNRVRPGQGAILGQVGQPPRPVPRGHAGGVFTVDSNPARGAWCQADGAPEQAGLARAVGTEQDDQFTGLQVERGVLYQRGTADGDRQVVRVQTLHWTPRIQLNGRLSHGRCVAAWRSRQRPAPRPGPPPRRA